MVYTIDNWSYLVIRQQATFATVSTGGDLVGLGDQGTVAGFLPLWLSVEPSPSLQEMQQSSRFRNR